MTLGVFRDFKSQAIIAFVMCSLLALTAHRLGLMDVSLDLLSPDTLVAMEHQHEGGMRSELHTGDHSIAIACELSDISAYSLCLLKLNYSRRNHFSRGLDLSNYQSVEIVATLKSPSGKENIKLYLRNNNPAYSLPHIDISDKFNTIEFELGDESTTLNVPSKALFVAQWWKRERDIGYEQSHVDISNIVSIELVIDEAKELGDYVLTVHSLSMSGEAITEPELLRLILLLLFMVIVLLTIRQKNNLKKISSTDPLTGLLNRRGMISKVRKEFKHIVEHHTISLFYFDVDDFKKINDTYGHPIGDELLVAICQKVKLIISEMNFEGRYSFARLAGDEFVLTITDCDKEKAIQVSRRIGQQLIDPIPVSGCEVKVGISLGLAYSSDKKASFKALLSQADSAMRCAKEQGKGRFKVFDDSLASAIYLKKSIAENLKNALINQDFSLRFMPIFSCSDLKPRRVEVLIRCELDAMQGVTPDVFIPIAEEFGIIQNIDLWVAETSFAAMQMHFLTPGRSCPVFCINISAIELLNSSFPKQLKKLMHKYQIPSEYIELEITETSLIEAGETSLSILKELKKLGVNLALDDFGTGYTGFNQLLAYPVDCLKIDRTFVADIDSEHASHLPMVNAIMSIAQSYNLVTVGEGVETQGQLDYLRSVSCNYVQGYFLAKPLLLDDYLLLLNDYA